MGGEEGISRSVKKNSNTKRGNGERNANYRAKAASHITQKGGGQEGEGVKQEFYTPDALFASEISETFNKRKWRHSNLGIVSGVAMAGGVKEGHQGVNYICNRERSMMPPRRKN